MVKQEQSHHQTVSLSKHFGRQITDVLFFTLSFVSPFTSPPFDFDSIFCQGVSIKGWDKNMIKLKKDYWKRIKTG